MATYNLSIASDADDGHESEGVWDSRTAEGYSQGEFFSVYQSNNAATDRLGALRFPATGIPQGSTITSATLTVQVTTATSIDSPNSVLLVTGDDVDNSPALSDSHRPSSGWTNTTATATQSTLAVGAVSINVASIVQEIVNRAGFSGGALAFKLGFSGSDTYWELNIADYDADTLASVATLQVITAEGGTVNTITLSSTVVLSDAGLASKTSGRLGSDTLAVADTSSPSMTSGRVASESLLIVDELSMFKTSGRVSSESLSVVDDGLDYVFYSRLGSDSLTVTDGPLELFNVYGVVAISEVVTTDDFVLWMRRHRLLEDNVLITDGLVSSVIGYLIFSSILTSNISVTDEALKTAYFYRLVESNVVTSDQLLTALLIVRDLLDGVDVTDSGLTAMQRFILLTDTLSVEDALTVLYVPATGPATDNPVIRIGFDQPEVMLGGYSVN